MPIRSGAMQRPRGCRCGNTLRQRYDEVGLPCSSTMGSPSLHLHVRHLATEDPPPQLLVRKCRRDHVAFSFFLCSGRMSSPRYVTLWPSLVLLLVCRVTTFSAFETLAPATWAPPSQSVPQGRDRALSRKGTADGGIVGAAGYGGRYGVARPHRAGWRRDRAASHRGRVPGRARSRATSH